jgi:hypothetical protein
MVFFYYPFLPGPRSYLSGFFFFFLIHERLELELMLQRGVKFEIEALSVHSLSFLSEEYIPSKIQLGVHI